MGNEMTVQLDGEEYLVHHDGGSLRIGRRLGGEVTWFDDVDTGVLPEAARTALQRGDAGDEALRTALRGVVSAEVERGG
ncbi:hypothetical protein DQ238_20950 [Geodermatophilus sp. TF02-6]|uniref:hypothetical protein n=1 Tax=Geodermatophilus sp. TF02-6 TaxID=2250575 RepID=UPI000DEA1E19|nr:hypothetical protein [Geodermatophilus sp. TF02-6]RBY74894.1 hypothetical protein DQ238_20950 [Geodermatophilus sp. TF02-6]